MKVLFALFFVSFIGVSAAERHTPPAPKNLEHPSMREWNGEDFNCAEYKEAGMIPMYKITLIDPKSVTVAFLKKCVAELKKQKFKHTVNNVITVAQGPVYETIGDITCAYVIPTSFPMFFTVSFLTLKNVTDESIQNCFSKLLKQLGMQPVDNNA